MACRAAEALEGGPAVLPDRGQRQALGRRLRTVLRAAGWDEGPAHARVSPPRDPALRRDLDWLCAQGEEAVWRRVVRRIWQDDACRQECDRDPGLRTLLRRHATRDRDQALTTLLACRIRRPAEIGLIGAVAARLWIAECCWDEMPYHLELTDPGPQALSPAQVRSCWLAARASQQHAVLHHPRILGGLPASGIPWPPAAADATLLPLRHALATATTPGPFLIRTQAALLAWSQPTIHDPALAATIHKLHAAGRAWEAYAGREPLLALRQEAPGRAPLQALHAVVLRLLREALARGTESDGCCQVPLGVAQDCPETTRAATLTVVRTAQHLLLPADRFSRLPCALGWLPHRYLSGIGAADWPWSALARCGWQAMTTPGPWQLVDAPPSLSGGLCGPWLALPLGST